MPDPDIASPFWDRYDTPRTQAMQEQPVADLSPEESIEFYRLAEELGSGRMSPADLARLAARRLYATPSQTARERENG